jgi:tRNA-2-methylthio-N6-dimethylallyladenosine synthase
MNEYDSNRILDLTKKISYISTKNIEEANCYILNTCHIREKATDKVYHEIGRRWFLAMAWHTICNC